MANGRMRLVEGAPNLMQRLPGLPSPPDVAFLTGESPTVSLGSYTPSLNSRSFRWCCIDLSNPRGLPDKCATAPYMSPLAH